MTTGLKWIIGVGAAALVLTLCLAGLTVAVVGSNVGSDSEVNTDQPAEVPTEPESEAASNVGRDGQFEFAVNGQTTGIDYVGDRPYGDEPVGEYHKVSVTITNIGDEQRSFDTFSNQYAFDADGNRYDADTGLTTYVTVNLNPGHQVEVDVYYDVPVDTELVSVQLHDGLFSGGVQLTIP